VTDGGGARLLAVCASAAVVAAAWQNRTFIWRWVFNYMIFLYDFCICIWLFCLIQLYTLALNIGLFDILSIVSNFQNF
jgi:hypothetical protein